ncbi:MAG: PAS domain S-box protein, partial [Oceanospirillales bacterium]
MLLTRVSKIATQQVITLDENNVIQDAVNLMADHHIQDVIIKGGEALRIITSDIVIMLRLAEVDFQSPLSSVSLPVVPCVHPDQKVSDALVALQGSSTEHICLVNDQQQLVGILSYTDLIHYLDPRSLAETRRIKEFLRLADFTLLSPETDLKTAMLKMHVASHSAALIQLPNDDIGILTLSDITRALKEQTDWQEPVSLFMTSPAFRVQDSLTLQDALSISREQNFKRLVICNADGKVVGLLHQKDLVALVSERIQGLLRRQEEQTLELSQFAENVPGMLYQYRLFTDGRSCFQYATNGIYDVYGFKPEDVVEDAALILQRLHPDDLERISQSIQQSAESMSIWEVQYRYIHPDKGLRWLEGRATPKKLSDNSVVWHGHIYDITQAKEDQLSHEAIRSRFELTMEATNTGLWSWDLITNDIKWSAIAFQQLGYESDAFPITLDKFRELVHPDDIDRMMQDVQVSIQKHFSFDVIFRLMHAQGHWVWIQGRGRVTKQDELGNPIYMMGTHTDISALTEAQKSISESEKRFSQLAVHSGTVTWEVDKSGLYTYVSPVCCDVWGYQPDELIGKVFVYNLHPKEGREQFKSDTLQLMTSGELLTQVLNPIQHKSGKTIWVMTDGYPIKNDQGEVIGYQGNDRDITAQKMAEDRAKKLEEKTSRHRIALDQIALTIAAQDKEEAILKTACESIGKA